MTKNLSAIALLTLAAAGAPLVGCSLDFAKFKFPAKVVADGGNDDGGSSRDGGPRNGSLKDVDAEAGKPGADAGTSDAAAGDAGKDSGMAMSCTKSGGCTPMDGSTKDAHTGGNDAAINDAAMADASDAGGTAPDSATVSCTSADDTCSDTNTLKTCKSNQHEFDMTSCLAGCSTTGTPHCQQLYPGAPVTSADLSTQGLMPITVPAGDTIVNTDTGAISGMITRAANLISTNVEVSSNGIAFHQTSGVGIFVFGDLTVASGATLKLVGANAAALVSEGNMFVYGTIDARPMDAAGTLCPSARVAGPGGAAGGAAGMSGPTPVNGTVGVGPGAGGGGTRGLQGNPGGGGGAGHATNGGTGSAGCHTGSPSNGGGAAGSAYTSGLAGGSGGGGGGAADGGGGGGAVRVVAAGVIRISDGTAVAGINAGACGGKGALGGGGGGSGGTIVLEAPFVEVGAMGTLATNGGGGGGQSSSTSYDGQAGGLNASPSYGAGSSQFSQLAGNGGAGDAPAGTTVSATCGTTEAMGGGGSAGTIQILARDGTPTVHAMAVLSPSKASTYASYAAADVH